MSTTTIVARPERPGTIRIAARLQDPLGPHAGLGYSLRQVSRATSDVALAGYDAAVGVYRETTLTAFQQVEDTRAFQSGPERAKPS